MERIGILPALAFAQVITYLVSNDYKTLHFRTIKRNIKKVLLCACIATMIFTMLFFVWPHFFLKILNKPDVYNDLIVYTLPVIALLILFDVLQLVLAGALRGAADVKTVMITRLVVTALFIPLSYAISVLPISHLLIKFVLLYASVHISLALMGLMYIIRFKSGTWKKLSIEE
jgi:Na+-driven multidrug efflux pump